MDAYLKFEDPEIKGDSEDEGHKGWIEVSQWNWDLEQKMTTAKSTGGARTAGQVSQSNFTFTKVMDKTTFDIYKHMAKGTHFKRVLLEVMRSVGEGGDHKMKMCTFEMNSVVIQKFAPDGGGDDQPTESLEINPGMVKFTYFHVDPKDPKANVEPKPFGWDFIANKPVA